MIVLVLVSLKLPVDDLVSTTVFETVLVGLSLSDALFDLVTVIVLVTDTESELEAEFEIDPVADMLTDSDMLLLTVLVIVTDGVMVTVSVTVSLGVTDAVTVGTSKEKALLARVCKASFEVTLGKINTWPFGKIAAAYFGPLSAAIALPDAAIRAALEIDGLPDGKSLSENSAKVTWDKSEAILPKITEPSLIGPLIATTEFGLLVTLNWASTAS